MKALFVFAHPDDESFSSGGTITKLTKSGSEVILITATRGEEGLCGNPPICTQKELPKVREEELRNAAKIEGIKQIYFLDYIDGTLKKVPLKKLIQKVTFLLEKEKPDIVFTFNKEGSSRHPDHKQINKAATKAFSAYAKNTKKHIRLYYTTQPKSLLKKLQEIGLSYTAFGKIKGTPNASITTIVNISETIDNKINAIKCHKTQHKDWERFLKRSSLPEFNFEFFELVEEYNFI